MQSTLRNAEAGHIIYINNTLINELKRFSILAAENSHWFNITDKEQVRLFRSLI